MPTPVSSTTTVARPWSADTSRRTLPPVAVTLTALSNTINKSCRISVGSPVIFASSNAPTSTCTCFCSARVRTASTASAATSSRYKGTWAIGRSPASARASVSRSPTTWPSRAASRSIAWNVTASRLASRSWPRATSALVRRIVTGARSSWAASAMKRRICSIERSIEQMRRFMADAAHELRAPVTILRTRAEVALGQDRDASRDAVTFQAIEREAARLGQVVGDLLTLARADAGERPIAQVPLYLDDVAAEAVDAVRTLAEQKQVQVEVGAFEEAKITGDPTLIRQLLLIVLDNAVKFTATGGKVRLDVSADHGRATVVVLDTGVGIPAEHLPHVFERFYRGEPARREADGAGLGLAIARWIVDAHHARIDVRSAPGTGTGVTITFPLSPP